MNQVILEMLTKAREVSLVIDGIKVPLTFSGSNLIPSAALLVQPNVFERRGRLWNLQYDGLGILMPDSKGMGYIHELIQHQNRFLSVTKLVTKLNGEAVDCVSESQLQNGDDEMCGLSVAPELRDALLTAEGRLRLQESLRYAKEELDASRENGQPDEALEKQEEIKKIEDYLKNSGFGTHAATFTNRADRDRTSVSNAISRAIKLIERDHPSLAKHLHNSIEKGVDCSYRPEKQISWVL